MSDPSPAVRVRGLVKSYGSVRAVRGIDLDIRSGEIFALLGPNGAGKTTTVEIREGYRNRDGGEVSVLGRDPGRERAKIKPRVGIVLQQPGVDQYLTVAETVALYAGYYPRPRSSGEVIDLVGLGGKRMRTSGTPLPAASFLGARVLHAMFVAVLLVVLTVAFGHGLPVEFLSGIFIPFDDTTPSWILRVARIFAVRHFVLSMQAGFIGTAFSWTDVLVVAAWGAAGLLVAIRFFSWEPRRG